MNRLRFGAAIACVALSIAWFSAADASSVDQDWAPNSIDPVLVAENFVAARNARDPFGASGWIAASMSIDDAQGQRIVDSRATMDWLRRLGDGYTFDMLVRPHADGAGVDWTERLTPRGIRFPESLSSSVDVDVHVVVEQGLIVAYRAQYPAVPDRPALPLAASSTPPTVASPRAADSPLFLFSVWAGVIGGVVLAVRFGPAVMRLSAPRRAPRG